MICKKIAAVSGVLSKLKHYLPKSVLIKIYFALAHTHLNYLIGVWGNANKKDVNELQVLQKRCLKHMCRLPRRHSTVDLFQRHCPDILNVNSLFKLNVCCYIQNSITGCAVHTVRSRLSEQDIPTTLETVNFEHLQKRRPKLVRVRLQLLDVTCLTIFP